MLKLVNVSKYYHSNDVVALGLRKVSLEFKLGEFIAVTGESGSGKSTLLNVISGLDTYEDGEMYVNSEETSYFSIEEWESYRRQYIGFVFQNYNIIDSYSVLENVMIALTIQGYDPINRKKRALELIDKVGLSSHAHHKASKLSGGQKQRAVIARALAKDCPIIVADEPTGNLDSESSKVVMSLLQEISKDKLVIVVTHNYSQVEEYATRKIRLFDGEVVEDKRTSNRKDVNDSVELATHKMNLGDLSLISLRNLFRTPRRTIFTMIVAMFIAIIFTFSYGSYVSETNGGISFQDTGYFTNVTESRIVVTKFDNSKFTPAELDSLSGLDRVNYLLEHDVVLDSYIMSYVSEYDYVYTRSNLINPASMLSTKDIKLGRLPTSTYEIVVEDFDEYSLGDTIKLGYDHPEFTSSDDFVNNTGIAFEIVGIVKNINPNSWEQRMYFHDDFIESDIVKVNAYITGRWGQAYVRYNLMLTGEDIGVNLSYNNYLIDDTLNDGEVEISWDILNELSLMVDQLPYEGNADFFLGLNFTLDGESNFFETTTDIEIVDEYTMDSDRGYNTIVMNQNTFNSLIPDETYQISILVTDTYDAEKVLEELEDLGYNAIYPSNIGNAFDEIIQLLSGLYFAFLMGLLMIVIYFISYIVLRNVQNSKKKDYLIFRSIGASKKDLNKVTILELLFTVTLAYIVTMVLLYVNELFDTFIPQYLRFFTVYSYITIFLLLTVLSLLLGNRFNKRIFSNSVITSLKQE